MKLQRIEIQNILGIKTFAHALTKPALLIAGPNGAGKSSIAEAIRQTITGEAERVSLKKDYPALLHNGAKAGLAAVEFEGFSASMTLPAGTHTNQGKVPAHLEYCLDPSRFARLSDNERRAFLFALSGIKVTPAAVRERLIARGIDPVKADAVGPLLAAGFEAARKEAQSKARDARAAWKAITGEAYGSVKADAWKAEAPALPVAEAGNDAEAIQSELDELTAHYGFLQAQRKARASAETELETLREKAGKYARIQDKLYRDEDQLAQWAQKLASAKPGAPCSCPECGAVLRYDAGTLAPATENALQVSADQLQNWQQAHDLLARSVANGKRDLADADAAARRLDEVEKASAPVDDGEIEALAMRLDLLRSKRKEAAAAQQAAAAAKAQAERAASDTEKAAAHHFDVQAWEAISEALAPEGIPDEFLYEAREPFNDLLRKYSDLAGWPTVSVAPSMAVLMGSREYQFRSESERWRADAIIAAAIAEASKAGFVMLDRFDLLDAKGRTEALYWIADIAQAGIGSLTLGTLKAIPQGIDEFGIDGIWLDKQAGNDERAAA